MHMIFFSNFLWHSLVFLSLAVSHAEVTRYSSEEISGNESTETRVLTETERQADFNRHKEEMKRKRRKKNRTSSSLQSSTFQGKFKQFLNIATYSLYISCKLLAWTSSTFFNKMNACLQKKPYPLSIWCNSDLIILIL